MIKGGSLQMRQQRSWEIKSPPRSLFETVREAGGEDRLPASWSTARNIKATQGGIASLHNWEYHWELISSRYVHRAEKSTWPRVSLGVGVVRQADCGNHQLAIIVPFLPGCSHPQRGRKRSSQGWKSRPATHPLGAVNNLSFTDTQIQRQ